MTGAYVVEVYNKRVHYKLNIRRNITIIRGNSGTGKTTLLNMIDEYDAGDTANVVVKCTNDVPCEVLERRSWRERIKKEKATIFFADESAKFVYTEDFAKAISGSKHYFVLVTRHDTHLAMIPYSVHEIYQLCVTGKYPKQQRMVVLNENIPLWRLRALRNTNIMQVLTEDTGTGFEFLQKISGGHCISAGGKGNIPALLCKMTQPTVVVADGAAFGAEMEKIMRIYSVVPQAIELYLPESFEWLLLHSYMFKHYKLLQRKLHEPEKYIESMQYISWERYFTALLSEYCNKNGFKYAKGGQLNEQFYSRKNLEYMMPYLPPSLCAFVQRKIGVK